MRLFQGVTPKLLLIFQLSKNHIYGSILWIKRNGANLRWD
jgi:hypothetical protein